jgi:hypothetical protein
LTAPVRFLHTLLQPEHAAQPDHVRAAGFLCSLSVVPGLPAKNREATVLLLAAFIICWAARRSDGLTSWIPDSFSWPDHNLAVWIAGSPNLAGRYHDRHRPGRRLHVARLILSIERTYLGGRSWVIPRDHRPGPDRWRLLWLWCALRAKRWIGGSSSFIFVSVAAPLLRPLRLK